ncbi:hypothetical protein IB276_33645 [Ensifer sp. ENS04]|uniref:hypothetical protein n=1 Tax=unclassified Ensifer TaxID=2633371 RepID=UPI0008EC79D4|nr:MULTISPECIES: hypothetical protein [unclassified Ensifer]MBD9544388.1 hypothetical protein [Ensifer sp. ENS04]SFH38500.1 hypothetical protein SAMN05216459_12918 [Ensifer sp. OV372]
MTSLKLMLAAAAIAGAFTAPAAARDAACPQQGDKAPLSLHKSWIMTGWERHEGDPRFVFAEKMRAYYDLENTTGVFYDNFAPGEKQLFRNAARYGANWEDLQNAARSVAHGLTDGHDEIIGDSVASTTLGFVGRIERLDGKVIAFDGRSQLGWQCVKGAWKIRHELNYAWTVEPKTIEKFLRKAQ